MGDTRTLGLHIQQSHMDKIAELQARIAELETSLKTCADVIAGRQKRVDELEREVAALRAFDEAMATKLPDTEQREERR